MLSKSVQFTNVAIYTLIFILVKSFYNFFLDPCLKVLHRSPRMNFVTLGNNLVLNVTYNNSGCGDVRVDWRNEIGLIVRRSRTGEIYPHDSRANIEMMSNLILRNTSFHDNGSYQFIASPKKGDRLLLKFVVIIRGRCVYSEYF